MSEHKAQHAHGHTKVYWWIFFGLVIGTILTVVAWKIHMPTLFLTVALALVIATAKASLVAGWFMHLTKEAKMIYVILGFTVFFFLGMMLLTVWAMADIPKPIFP